MRRQLPPLVGAIVDEAVGRIDAAVIAALAEADADRGPVIVGRDVDHRNAARYPAPAAARAPPIGLIDLDHAGIVDLGDDGDMARRHAAIRHEAHDGPDLGAVAALIKSDGMAPPLAGIAGDVHAGLLAGEGDAVQIGPAMIGGVAEVMAGVAGTPAAGARFRV